MIHVQWAAANLLPNKIVNRMWNFLRITFSICWICVHAEYFMHMKLWWKYLRNGNLMQYIYKLWDCYETNSLNHTNGSDEMWFRFKRMCMDVAKSKGIFFSQCWWLLRVKVTDKFKVPGYIYYIFFTNLFSDLNLINAVGNALKHFPLRISSSNFSQSQFLIPSHSTVLQL